MESSRFSESLRHRLLLLRELRTGPTVFGLVVAVVATWIIVAVANTRDPEDTVEDFLTAVADKDVEDALALAIDVDYGESAKLLTPEAISGDWWVESVTEISRAGFTADVKAVIAGPGGTTGGVFTVGHHNDEWLLRNPFVTVEFPASPVSYIQVNDHIARGEENEKYQLFPGLYRFYRTNPGVVAGPEAEVVAAFPQRDSPAKVVRPGRLTAGKKPAEEAQRRLDALIDDCAGFTTKVPHGGCPFATDGEIDTPDGRRVTDLHSLKWTVEKHPVIELADERPTSQVTGFSLRVTEPGTVKLTGGGTDTDGNPATFTVTCAIDTTGAEATVGANGAVRVTVPPRGQLGDTIDTCRGNA